MTFRDDLVCDGPALIFMWHQGDTKLGPYAVNIGSIVGIFALVLLFKLLLFLLVIADRGQDAHKYATLADLVERF